MDVEVCIESLAEAKLAVQFGAKRVEVCSALDLGGLTPSAGLIQQCSEISQIEVHILIRPRSGHFAYSKEELSTMKADIERAAQYGVKGVVFGILTLENEIDLNSNIELLELAKLLQMEATFHRAFDLANNPTKSLSDLINLGFDRLLTSGQKPTAVEGISLISDLVEKAGNRIEIMAGSGVNGSNVQELVKTGIDAIHFSSRKKQAESPLSMGTASAPDSEKIAEIMKQLKS